MPPAVRLTGVTKTYSEAGVDKSILRGVDLEIAPGELVVLLGRSGSGKSTLLELIGGIDRPDTGTVEIDGADITHLSERERSLFRRHRIGYVFQFFNLVPTLTVEENVMLRPDLVGADATTRDEALLLLDELGLGERSESWPDRLSGGEQQRVAIVAALAHRPKLVLADEPTGNLDLATGRGVTELLDRLTRRQGHTLIMATHSAEVMGVADRVLRMEDGVLVDVPNNGDNDVADAAAVTTSTLKSTRDAS